MGTSEGAIGNGAMVGAVMFQIDKGTEGGTGGTESIGLDAALALFVLDDRDGERSEFFDGRAASSPASVMSIVVRRATMKP